MRRTIQTVITAAALFAAAVCTAKPPRIVVNIVVSSMRADDLDRYRAGFGDGGFKRLAGGTRYTEAGYDFMQTLTPVTLATLATGAQPSTHGVVGTAWYDYVDNRRVELLTDRTVSGFGYPNSYDGRFSPVNLLAPTIGDAMYTAWPESRVATVALDPESAVVIGGRHGVAYWMEPSRAMWSSSTYYMLSLPEWVEEYNRELPRSYALSAGAWTLHRAAETYVNRRAADIVLPRSKKGASPR